MATKAVVSGGPQEQSQYCPDPYLYKIRDLVYQVAGIFQPDSKLNFLEDRCERRMKAVGVQSHRDYLEHLTRKADRENELHSLLDEITVGETCFFRSREQIQALSTVVIPSVIESRNKSSFRRFRIWSAGCSTGEEPYTLAMLLMEQMQGVLNGWTFEILGTDLNGGSLVKAKEGIYNEYALRNVSPNVRQKYFRPHGDRFQVCDEVKANVSFNRLNLFDDSKMLFMKGMDAIFCCNVLIYFDGASKRRVIQHFYNNVMPGGYLFLGLCESLFGVTDNFRLVHFPGTTAYCKGGGKPAPRGAQ